MAFLSAGAGGECTEDEGISGTGINGNGADEVGGCNRVTFSVSFQIPLSNPFCFDVSLVATSSYAIY